MELQKYIDTGAKQADLWDKFFPTMLRTHRAVGEYKRIKTPQRSEVPIVIIIWGPTGTGKTRVARNIGAFTYGDQEVYMAPQAKGSGCYFDDYDAHDCLILDEFYGNRMPWSNLLTMLDRYPNILASHGGAGRQNVAKMLILTSNKHPMFWYNSDKINWAPLRRRATLIIKLGSYAPECFRHLVPQVEVFPTCSTVWPTRPKDLVSVVGVSRGVLRSAGQVPLRTMIVNGVTFIEKK